MPLHDDPVGCFEIVSYSPIPVLRPGTKREEKQRGRMTEQGTENKEQGCGVAGKTASGKNDLTSAAQWCIIIEKDDFQIIERDDFQGKPMNRNRIIAIRRIARIAAIAISWPASR